MENRDADVDLILGRAKWLEEHGERAQALELYRSALDQITDDDPRRDEIETAVTYLEFPNVLAFEPAQMRAWHNLMGWSQNWHPLRWGFVILLVFFELGLLLLGKNLDLQGNSRVALLPPTGTPGLDQPMPDSPKLDLLLAPTPLALAPTAIDSPTPEPTPTETILPSPTATSTPTLMAPTVAAPANSNGGNQGANTGATGTLPTSAVPPGAPPQPVQTPQPPPVPPPGPTPQPPPGPTTNPGSGTQPTPGPGPGGSGGPGGGGNHGGNGKGNGKGGGPGKGKGKGGG